MEAQRQLLVLNPGAGNWSDEALETPSDLFEERTARVGRRMRVSESRALEFQAVVANVDQARQPHVPFEVSKSPATHESHPKPRQARELFEKALCVYREASL